jgi:NodT family efflux transporter outer membrane factor (OMF) lipoprotein
MEALIFTAIALTVGGCTSPREYIHNCFKVGPDPCVPAGPTAARWIDDADQRVRSESADLERWWTVFRDPTLDRLIVSASRQNISLREAGFRILEARAHLGIAKGSLFPQSQGAYGWYQRAAASQVINSSPGFEDQFFSDWGTGFNLSWELDFWGRFRRAVIAAENTLEASCFNYDQVLVTLLGDVAANYVQVRTLQQRIEYVHANAALQKKVLDVAEQGWKKGAKNALDFHQARSNLTQTEAQVPQLQMAVRQACDRLCVLLGTPPTQLEKEFGPGAIPGAPPSIAIGIPAELLCRRPDVRRAERLAAAQGQQIGIAEAELYPMFAINGTIGVESEKLSQLFTKPAFTGAVGPVFQWNILNYGRIRNNMRMQDARFQALIAAYQETVLRANAEVEDGLAAFLRSQERAKLLDESVASAQQAVAIVDKEYQGGAADFNRVALIQQTLVQQQDLQAQAHGDIAQGLIQVYRALGGGWQAGLPVETMAGPAPSMDPVPPPPDQPAPAVPGKPISSAVPDAPMPPETETTGPTPTLAPAPEAPMPPEVKSTTEAPAPVSAPVAPMPPDTKATTEAPAPTLVPPAPVAPMPPDTKSTSQSRARALPVAPMPPDVKLASHHAEKKAVKRTSAELPVAPMPPGTK